MVAFIRRVVLKQSAILKVHLESAAFFERHIFQRTLFQRFDFKSFLLQFRNDFFRSKRSNTLRMPGKVINQ